MTLKHDQPNGGIATRIVSLGILILVASTWSWAQYPAARSRGGGAYELSGTFTHVLTDGTFNAPLGMNGWTASASGRLLPLVQLTGEVGGYRKTGVSMYSFLGGPQVKMRLWRVEPFARGLFGLSHVSGTNNFSMLGGGGIDVPVANHFSIRALQCDYYRFLGNLSKTDLLRIGVGVTYSFGD